MKKVTRSFLLRLADRIHNPATGEFLYLCRGVLTNGPDPTNKRRTMHCGLGELYYAITGQHPDRGSETAVVDLAVNQSTLKRLTGAEVLKTLDKAFGRLDLPEATLDFLRTHTATFRLANYGRHGEDQFRKVLDSIPGKNDKGRGFCTRTGYRRRACRVAAVFRRAAELLPA